MSKIIKFIFNIIFFIPKLLLESIGSLFKLILLLVIIGVLIIYGGKYSVKKFFEPSQKSSSTESS